LYQRFDGDHRTILFRMFSRAVRGIFAHDVEVFEARRRSPRDDVISDLVKVEQGGDVMSVNEVANFVMLLLIAGNETTTNLIGNAVLALGGQPDLLHTLADDPTLASEAVEETLRYDSPVPLTLRRATEDIELSGGKVRAGEQVALLIGSANRDERQFEAADRFGLDRYEVDAETPERGKYRHLAFGIGTHFCVGSDLARLEARIALEVLVSRFPNLSVLDPLPDVGPRLPSLLMRGVRSLRVRLGCHPPTATGSF